MSMYFKKNHHKAQSTHFTAIHASIQNINTPMNQQSSFIGHPNFVNSLIIHSDEAASHTEL